MQRAQVALIPVASYDAALCSEAVEKAVSLLGGWEKFVSPDQKILLKPNLLTKATAAKAVTTNPAIMAAVAKSLQQHGYNDLRYGDSPGTNNPKECASACGIAQEMEKLNIPMADFTSNVTVPFPQGEACTSFTMATGIRECDAVVNVCKMKTHALMRVTGAAKNLYGCIQGFNKGLGHVTYPDADSFAQMIIELNKAVPARLHIMDGIVAMEGNGPSSGVPREMKVLLASADPIALDSVFCALIRVPAESVPTCEWGEKKGLGVMDQSQIDVLTPDGVITPAQAYEKYGCADFDVFRGMLKKNVLSRLTKLLPFMQAIPKVDQNKCIGCGLCEKSCPVEGKAIHAGNGQKAVYDRKKCIRCFCCQELCPVKAVEVHRPLPLRLIGGK